MVASVLIRERTTTASATDKTSATIRFKNANNATDDSSNPLVIPTSGREFSFEKWLQLRIGTAAPSDRINNIQFYTDGGNGLGTGVMLYITDSTTFRTPGIPNEANATPLGGSGSNTMVNAFTYTANAALSLSSGDFSGSSTDIGNFGVLVMRVTSTASPGATPTETITFSYDEI